MKNKTILKLTKISIFAALSTVLYFIKFPLPIFPSFLEIQFSVLPAIIGGFSMGPISGIIIVLIKFLISLPFSKTAYVGDFADLLIGGVTVLVASIVYSRNKTKKGGLIALVAGAFTWIIVACFANYFILVPAYLEMFFKGEVSSFIAVCSLVIPSMDEGNYLIKYLLYAVIPFNGLIATVTSLITFIVYKKISSLLHMMDKEE